MRSITTQPRVTRLPRRGAAAVLAMLFLVLLSTLSVAMYAMATTNAHTARNYADGNRARSLAESGLRWASWRFVRMTRPKTAVGNITPAVANTLWSPIRTAITNDYATMSKAAERTVTWSGMVLSSAPIAADESAGRFVITYRQHPLYVGDPLDQRYLRVTSNGTYGNAKRSVSMDFKIDKKVKFAIVGKVPIQIGRNTLVEGPMGMATANKFPPYLLLSDFRHLKPSLKTKIDAFNAFLELKHNGYDGRINVNNATEFAAATAAGYTDYNADSFIDEYDLFVKEFDANGDKAITAAEFTNPSTGQLYDADLFKAIDTLGGPLFDEDLNKNGVLDLTEDANGNGRLDAGEDRNGNGRLDLSEDDNSNGALDVDVTRAGYKDNKIDNRDGYSKIRGTVTMAATAAAWQANIGSGGAINDYLAGPIQGTDSNQLPILFAADSSQIFDLSPANFDTDTFRNRTGPENGTSTKVGAVLTNRVILASDANNGTADERTPYGSTSYQATYRRPRFKNMTFRNCRIPKGLNALFDNCVFEGTTFVDLTEDITDANGNVTTSQTAAMTWSQKMKSGSFSNSTVLTAANSYGFERGNNLRFNNCTMYGPLASSVPSAYSHFSNSWEFTGSTLFDNQSDNTATIVAPQTNIEMGSFTDPAGAPSTLIGVVVAGNLDVRGSSVVDGSIIITGDGAGNTTQGWFGPSDSDTDVTTPMPEGGYGRLSIRYNPNRALPDGINIAIDILPEIGTYTEVPQ